MVIFPRTILKPSLISPLTTNLAVRVSVLEFLGLARRGGSAQQQAEENGKMGKWENGKMRKWENEIL
jgi:hypothetical protein